MHNALGDRAPAVIDVGWVAYSLASTCAESSESEASLAAPLILRRWKRGVPRKLFLMLFVIFVRHCVPVSGDACAPPAPAAG